MGRLHQQFLKFLLFLTLLSLSSRCSPIHDPVPDSRNQRQPAPNPEAPKKNPPDEKDGADEGPGSEIRVVFNELLDLGLRAHCVSCHQPGASGQRINLRDFDDQSPNGMFTNMRYPNLINFDQPANSQLYQSVFTGRMPPWLIPDEEYELLIKAILEWIEDGALDSR